MFKIASVTSCVVLTCLFNVVMLRSTKEDDHYWAAVLEYNYDNSVATNLANYQVFVEQAASQNADIIVFPEATLTRTRNDSVRVPFHDLLKEYPTPALQPDLYDEVLVKISESARTHEIYVVINVQEVMDCNSIEAANEVCPERKEYLFNTNVVFDRNGSVISRYRKINLYDEAGRSPALNPELGVFDTDFGVKFGQFISFDLLFQVPAVKVTSEVTNVIFPTMWFSGLPYLTAVQIQEAYAYTMGINLLASGANRITVGSTGSGIFSGEAGAVTSIMSGQPLTELLVARVPKVPGKVFNLDGGYLGNNPGPTYAPPAELHQVFLMVDPSLKDAKTQLLEDGINWVDLEEGEISCNFEVNMEHGSAQNRYRYRAAAFDGLRTFENVLSIGVRSCAVFACTGDDISTCGSRFPVYNKDSFATFTRVNIISSFPKPVINSTTNTMNSIYYPVSVTSSLQPLKSDQYTLSKTTSPESDPHVITIYNLRNLRSDLYAFGVWGRVFATDGQTPGPAPGSASSVLTNVVLVLFVFLYHIM